ncbi:hypothetical protein KEM52_006522 [Ascosphaera acerosa]|nr:hypothetical protein KEM52_006522 [Ascosphaera acerosa]
MAPYAITAATAQTGRGGGGDGKGVDATAERLKQAFVDGLSGQTEQLHGLRHGASDSALAVRADDFDGGNTRGSSSRSFQPGQGAVPPDHINNAGMLALFAILGAAFVLTAIWFFFWAKDGGFEWTEHDWDDYKSTVLRRKDADGRTLTNATPSTNLGGGSIVRGEGYYYDEDEDEERDEGRWWRRRPRGGGSAIPDATETQLSSASRFKGRLMAAKDRFFRRKTNDEDSDVQAYRNEKPARVGGINTDSEATYSHSGAYDPYESTLDPRGAVGGGNGHHNPRRPDRELLSSQADSRPTDTELTDYRYPSEDDHDRGHDRYMEGARADRRLLDRNASDYSFLPGDDEALSSIPEERSFRAGASKARRSARRTRTRRQQGPEYSQLTGTATDTGTGLSSEGSELTAPTAPHDPRPSRASQRRRDRESSRPRTRVQSQSQPQSAHQHGRSRSRAARSHSRQARPRRRYDEPSESASSTADSYGYGHGYADGGDRLDVTVSAGGSSEYDYSHARARTESDLESAPAMGPGRERGHESYHHPIPGLSKGFRRGRKGRSRRRDSLSESENELMYEER